MKVAKKNGVKQQLDQGKLWDSLYYPAKEAHLEKKDAIELADEVKHELINWMKHHEDNVFTTREIGERAEELLAKKNNDAALMYDKHLDIN